MSKNLQNSSLKSRALKNTPRAFVKRVHNTLHKSGILPSGSSILVAVSGGPDSMALVYILHELKKSFDWQLSVAHVNYGLRGKESDDDESLVKNTAQKLDIPFHTLKSTLSPHSSEDVLRTFRYAFFEKLVSEHGFDVVALAHHQDDQAETVLMRLIRGSGSLGLSGMRLKRDAYVRPLLPFPKQHILDFLEQSKIPYRLDASNTENFYFRNKVRNVLIPLLETYNPNIKKVLADTAHTLQEEETLKSSRAASTPFLVTQAENHYSWSLGTWNSLSEASKAALLRQLFQKNNLPLPTKSLLETLLHDSALPQKKGFAKEYSRLRLLVNNGMIDIHFKELD